MKKILALALLASLGVANAAPSDVPATNPAPSQQPTTAAPDIQVENDEASYIRRLHSVRRDLELTTQQALVAEQRLRIAEANKKIKKAVEGSDDTNDGKVVRKSSALSNVGEENAAGEGGMPMMPRPATVLADQAASKGQQSPVSDQPPKAPVAPVAPIVPASPKVVGITGDAAQIDYKGEVSTRRSGEEFDHYRVISINFDSVTMEMPDGSRNRVGVSWPQSY